MENCLYHGKLICTYDLKDNNGIYYEDLVLDWKQAAADRLLTCVECGAHVYLAAGPVKEPYFAHYDLENCDYGNGHETEELRKGKRLLYQLLKLSFPESDIRARFRMENGMYSTFYCLTQNDEALAVDYRLLNNSLEKYRLRDTFYQANHIKPIYVMGIRQEKNITQIDWYQSLLQCSMGYLVFLDTVKERIILKKSFGYRIGNERKFKYCIETYSIWELRLNSDGQMICEFNKKCVRIEEQIRIEKLQYTKQQEQLQRMQEEYRKLNENELIRQEAYRLKKEEERVEAGTGVYQQKQETHLTGDYSKYLADHIEYNKYSDTGEIVKQQADISALNPIILEKCRKMIEEGNAHLVSKKYYDAIIAENNKIT